MMLWYHSYLYMYQLLLPVIPCNVDDDAYHAVVHLKVSLSNALGHVFLTIVDVGYE